MAERYVSLANSEPKQLPAVMSRREEPDPNQIIQVTVLVRSRLPEAKKVAAVRKLARQLPYERSYLTPDEFEKLHGAAPEDLARVKSFAKEQGLDIIEAKAARGCVVLSGTLQAFGKAFRVQFAKYEDARQYVYRSHVGLVSIPAALSGIITGVLGLDDRPVFDRSAVIMPAHVVGGRHTEAKKVAQLYDFPSAVNGKRQCIAIIELGGGFYSSDLDAFFTRHHLAKPKVTTVELDGQKNHPADRSDIKRILDAMGVGRNLVNGGARQPQDSKPDVLAMWTIEATMDIELVGAFANGAHVVVYFAPNNSQGKYHAFSTALTDTKYNPSVISCSWGAHEEVLSSAFLDSMESLFQAAALKGVTICGASGDDGGTTRVQFPASSPHVLGCGGTHLTVYNRAVKETVWSEKLAGCLVQTAGGASSVFKRPAWQKGAHVRRKVGKAGRGVPDVAGKADVKSGYCMIVGQLDIAMGGTSASAPMWAGLLALMNQKLGTRVGYLNPLLYTARFKDALRHITKGHTSSVLRAGPGWNPCTGLGSPHGKKLVDALSPGHP